MLSKFKVLIVSIGTEGSEEEGDNFFKQKIICVLGLFRLFPRNEKTAFPVRFIIIQ